MLTCRHCGYDLRGLPDNICPECGHAFDPNAPEEPREGGNGVVGASLSVIVSSIVVFRCLALALAMVLINHSGCCCCCAGEQGGEMLITGFGGTILCATGWALAARVPTYSTIARCATATALVAWITCGILSAY